MDCHNHSNKREERMAEAISDNTAVMREVATAIGEQRELGRAIVTAIRDKES